MKKVYDDAVAALDGLLFDGMTIMAGGFGLCGIPEHLILALRDSGVSFKYKERAASMTPVFRARRLQICM